MLFKAPKEYGYHLMYASMFGGVTAFTPEQFKKINGFSNQFWDWGGEDDDSWNRVHGKKYKVERPDQNIGR